LVTTFSLVQVLLFPEQVLLFPGQVLLFPGQVLPPSPEPELPVLLLSLVLAPALPVSPLLSERVSPALEPGRTRSKKNLQKRK